jgi:putative nucleotidyltransferase with HDIG domain
MAVNWAVQALLYADDLRRVMDELQEKNQQTELLRTQLLTYAEDLNREWKLERYRSQQMEQLLVATVGALANAIEARDPYTRGHTDRVSRMALVLCEAMGWNRERLRVAKMGSLLHDIGKIGVPDSILLKPGRLEPAEMERMRAHPTIGAMILQGIDELKPAVPFVVAHHERWDGRGYPKGLAAEQIPIEGRILAIADSFDAMTSARPYRAPLALDEAAAEIRRCAGTQFDPQMVALFDDLFRAGLIESALAGGGSGVDPYGVDAH